MQQLLSTVLLPPIGLVLVMVIATWLALRDHRWGGWLGFATGLALLLLATPEIAQSLRYSLERDVPTTVPTDGPLPQAVIILGGDSMRGGAGPDIGPLTLERLRAGAALARRTGLPILVTGGPNGRPTDPPLAVMMAGSLADDFGRPARWIEPRARDTHDNAEFSAAALRAEGIGAAYVVSHGWHLPRAVEAFGRLGFPVTPVPVRTAFRPEGGVASWTPRPDYWALSWYMLREWLGRLVYALKG